MLRAFWSLTGKGFRLHATANTWLALGVAAGALLTAAAPCDAQWYHKKKKVNKSTSPENTAEPDKILYDRAMNDVKRGRHETGRLALQTLINTYPDSEYLAKAKLAIADSFYKEGGTANMVQAIQTYKDFGIFFPFLSEAAYAQLQVANAHYQQMAKPDRDRTEAKAAEEEYQVFLQKYPNDPLAAKAEQRLRNVQEIIAEGDYRIGYFYYVKGDQRAAAARLMALNKRYPLFSKADKVLSMLGSIFEKSEHKEIASLYYSQIVRNYPLSGYVGDAKTKLTAFKVPIPQADPKAVAWMTAEQKAPREREGLLKKPLALVRSGPRAELFVAAQSGQPNLEPEADTTSATDILSGSNRSQIGVSGGGPGNTAVVETVTPGGAAPSTQPATEGGTPAASPESSAPNGAATEPTKPATSDASSATAPAAPGTNGNTASGSGPATGDTAKSDSPTTDSPQSADAAKSGDKSNGKKEKESSSKKKKHKVLPW